MERSEPGHRPEINSAIYSPTDVVLELSGEVENGMNIEILIIIFYVFII